MGNSHFRCRWRQVVQQAGRERSAGTVESSQSTCYARIEGSLGFMQWQQGKASSLIQSSFAAVTCQLLAGATRERGQFSLPRWCTQEERSTMPTQPSVAPNDSLSDSALFNCLHLQVKARGNALSFNFVFTRSGAN